MDEDNLLPELQLQHMHKIIMELFLNSCNVIIKEDLQDHEYQYCVDTIHNTLIYINSKRKEKKFQTLNALRGLRFENLENNEHV